MRKGIVIGAMLVVTLSLTACSSKKNLQEESTVFHKDISQKEVYEKGYNLPVEDKEKEEAKYECRQMMQKIEKIYLGCNKGTASNVHISEKTALEMLDVLRTSECPMYYYSNMGMCNYDKMENFLNHSSKGQKGKIVVYQVNSEGGVARNKFIFDGQDMYLLYTNCTWSEDNAPVIGESFYNRIKEWEYTKKGWFCYELCVPEPPELTEVMDGNCMLRVKPIREEYREIAEKYLLPLGYQGNNLLCSNWDATNLKDLDYNGLYEYLYYIKYQEKLNSEEYQNGIPKEEFENLITEYLPVTVKQLRRYAAFDPKDQTYAWCRLGCMNYTPNAFGGAMPEITDIKENKDGSVSITIDAVCEMLKNDSVISHMLTVKIYHDGRIQYLSNRVLDDGLKKIPKYQYRVKK